MKYKSDLRKTANQNFTNIARLLISNRLEKSSKIHSKFLLSVSVIILAKAIYE